MGSGNREPERKHRMQSTGDLRVGHSTGIDDSWYRRPPGMPAHISAGGVVARVERGRVHIALVREGTRFQYVLPKGHVESGEMVEQAARREIAEETGLADLELLGTLGVRERLDFDRTSWKTTHYFLFVTTQRQGSSAHSGHEMTWFPIDALPPMFWPEQRDLLESNREKIVALVNPYGAQEI